MHAFFVMNQADLRHVPQKQIQLLSSPDYILITTTVDQEKGLELIKKAIETIQSEIKKHGGDCVIKTEVYLSLAYFLCCNAVLQLLILETISLYAQARVVE